MATCTVHPSPILAVSFVRSFVSDVSFSSADKWLSERGSSTKFDYSLPLKKNNRVQRVFHMPMPTNGPSFLRRSFDNAPSSLAFVSIPHRPVEPVFCLMLIRLQCTVSTVLRSPSLQFSRFKLSPQGLFRLFPDFSPFLFVKQKIGKNLKESLLCLASLDYQIKFLDYICFLRLACPVLPNSIQSLLL